MSRSRCAILVLVLLSAYAYWLPTRGWNELSRLDLVRAVVEEGTFRIDSYHTNTGDKAEFNGHYYSDKAPGAALLGVPVHFVLRRWLGFYSPRLTPHIISLVTVTLPSVAGSLMLLGLLCRVMPERERLAIGLALAYGLATTALPYSTHYFGHQIAAAAIIGALYLQIADERAAMSPWRLVSTGSLLGLAVVTEYPAVLLAVVVVAYGVWRTAHRATRAIRGAGLAAALVVAGAAPFAAALALYNAACFGQLFANPYQHHETFRQVMTQGFSGVGLPDLRALWGITLEPGRGLFFLSPFLLLAFPGMVMMIASRRRRAEGVMFAAGIVVYLAFSASYKYWHGVSGIGPRFLVPALPLFIVPAGYAVRASRVLLALLIGLAGASGFHIWMGMASPVEPIIEISSVVWGYWSTQLASGAVTPSWGTAAGLRGLHSLLPLVLLATGLAVWLVLWPRTGWSRRWRCWLPQGPSHYPGTWTIVIGPPMITRGLKRWSP